ncbi:MAG: peptidylprolyl isomerase [Anaerolineales bacterium]|nr:peptidylprolyl isomerase [Anaerolineales bacterium]
MDNAQKPTKVSDDIVVSMDYTLTVNGEVVDSSHGRKPLEFIQGRGNIIRGLEQELYDMTTGESKQVSVAAKDGYGEVNPDAFLTILRNDFPEDIQIITGQQNQLGDQDGHVYNGIIEKIEGDNVHVNMNHPMAGKQLDFSITVVDLRLATPTELQHGHTH